MTLGTKLILYLVGTVIIAMATHGYLSIRQDKDNVTSEIRVGMGGFSRALQAALTDTYGNLQNLKSTQDIIDKIGPKGNIHGIVVYDTTGKQVAVSASLTDTREYPHLDPAPVLQIDPLPVINDGQGLDGYVHGDRLIYYRVEPIFNEDNELVGTFVLGRQGSGATRAIERRRDRIVTTTSTLVLVLSVLILLIVHRHVSRPIRQLIERVREIGEGRWEQRIEVPGRNEIGALATEFNHMSERLQATYSQLVREQEERIKLERDLRHSEKLASVGQLAAGLAHEIGTPLNIIGGRAEYLVRRQRRPEEIDENLHIIQSQIDRIAGIVRQLLEFSRRKEPALRGVDILSLFANVKRLLQHKIEEKAVDVRIAPSTALPRIKADPDLLQQVFINLFVNSLHAMQDRGTIRITAGILADGKPEPAGNWLTIFFEDDGPGIPAGDIEHVFDPFFTTKDVGEGTGLGLSVTYGIVRDHGGEIRVESEQGSFTRFIIRLPVIPGRLTSNDR